MSSNSSGAVAEWDDGQLNVIAASGDRRLLVDAGPGTGKTAVACARLAHLILHEGLNPARTWMISFTRTAVAEIRARLFAYVGEDSFAIKIATLDAHAWSLHSGFDKGAKLTGTYENNIEQVLGLIEGDPDTQDYLSSVRHLVIDEAQDLVGIRARLARRVVEALDPDCGVTVFADEAQAVYDFSEDRSEAGGQSLSTLMETLAQLEPKFERVSLDHVHRTSSSALQAIFRDVRGEVLNGESAGLFAKVKGRIRELVGIEEPSCTSNPPWGTLESGTLVLFRTRAEALQAAQFCSTPYSLRMGGYSATLPAWIAICFHDWTAQRMPLTEFESRWNARVRKACEPDYGVQEAWGRLYRLAGADSTTLDMPLLRARLSRRALPVSLAQNEYGLPGPVIGTIHASKGREANEVLLYLGDPEEFKSEDAEREETRVMFVGSTRARSRLRLGRASRNYARQLRSGRLFKSLSNRKSVAAMVEIGRPEDQSFAGVVGRDAGEQVEVLLAQKWLAKHACVQTTLTLQASETLDWRYRAIAELDGIAVSTVSKGLTYDLWEMIDRIADRKKFRPHPTIKYIRSLGAQTIVSPPEAPQQEVLHEPWRSSGFALAPRLAAFTKVNVWSR